MWANNEPRSWVAQWTRRSRSRLYSSVFQVLFVEVQAFRPSCGWLRSSLVLQLLAAVLGQIILLLLPRQQVQQDVVVVRRLPVSRPWRLLYSDFVTPHQWPALVVWGSASREWQPCLPLLLQLLLQLWQHLFLPNAAVIIIKTHRTDLAFFTVTVIDELIYCSIL